MKPVGAWYQRNEAWLHPLLCSVIVRVAIAITEPILREGHAGDALATGGSILLAIAWLLSFLGGFLSTFMAVRVATISAKVYCLVVFVTGWAVMIFLFVEWLKK